MGITALAFLPARNAIWDDDVPGARALAIVRSMTRAKIRVRPWNALSVEVPPAPDSASRLTKSLTKRPGRSATPGTPRSSWDASAQVTGDV